MATVSEFLRDLFPLVKQQGFTASYGEEGFIGAINAGLSYIYCYKSHRRNWQIRTEPLRADEHGRLYGITSRPIVDVNNFWCGKKLECIKQREKERETCCANKTVKCSKCASCCQLDGCRLCSTEKVLDMIQVSPGGILTSGTYKISGSENNMGGMFGNYVEARAPKDTCCSCTTCEQIYFTYVSRFNNVKCPQDEIPLPDAYLPALMFACAAFTVMGYLSFRASDDASYLAMCDRILDGLDGLQVNIPTMIRDTSTVMETNISKISSSGAFNSF